MYKKEEALLLGIGSFTTGVVLANIALQKPSPNILDLCMKMENAKLSPEEFVEGVYLLSTGKKPTPSSLEYWVSRWYSDPIGELDTNLFAGSTVPIVGLNSEDSTRARTLASLIVRAQISLSATASFKGKQSNSMSWILLYP